MNKHHVSKYAKVEVEIETQYEEAFSDEIFQAQDWHYETKKANEPLKATVSAVDSGVIGKPTNLNDNRASGHKARGAFRPSFPNDKSSKNRWGKIVD